MITTPVRNYLILLFVAIVGIGAYMVIKQQNDDYDNTAAQAGQNLKAAPVPTATAIPASTASPTALNTTQEADDINTLLSDVPDTDFSESSLSTTSLGL
jgi:uncharacterized protein HemX